MKVFSLLLLLPILAVAQPPDPFELQVIDEGDKWVSGGHSKKFFNERCKVKLQADGQLVVNRLVEPNVYEVAWAAVENPPGPGDYYAILNKDNGSLEIYDKPTGTLIYTTNIPNMPDPEALDRVFPPPHTSHKLTINEHCVLRIYRDDVMVWASVFYGGFDGNRPGVSNFLEQGEMMNVEKCVIRPPAVNCVTEAYTLLLQNDCNLVQFQGRDRADYGRHGPVFWDSGTDGSAADCYLYMDIDKVRLYDGKVNKNLRQFDTRPDPVLWEADPSFVNPCGSAYKLSLIPEPDGGGPTPTC